MIFLKSICPVLCLLKMTYLNLVSNQDYPFKEKPEWLTPSSLQSTIRKLVLLHAEWPCSHIFVQELLCVSEKSQSSCFFHKRVMQLLTIITLQHYVSYPWSGVRIIQPTMQLRFLLSQPRGLRLPADWVNSSCISDRKTIIGEEMVRFPVRSLCLPLTSLRKRTEKLRIPLRRIFARQCFLCFLSALLPFTVVSCSPSVIAFLASSLAIYVYFSWIVIFYINKYTPPLIRMCLYGQMRSLLILF